MIRIGIVGIGFMGMIHYLAARKLKGAQVTAICSRDAKKLTGDWRSIRGNFGPPGQMMDLGSIKRYDRVEKLLADPEIDLVDICNPTHLHPETAIQALKAGKHVLVEKCIALTPRDADAMLETAAKAGKLLMVAHVLPFFAEFAYAAEAIRGGRFGKLLGGHFKRVISKPDWSAEIGDASKTGGPAIDLHIHDTHFIGLVCGVPRAVFSTGVVQDGAVQYLTTQYLYGSVGPPHPSPSPPGGEGGVTGPCVSCSSGALAQKGRPFVHGYEIYLQRATLVYESGATPLTVLHSEGRIEQPKFEGGDDGTAAFTVEIQTAVDGVVANRLPDLLSGKLARDALAMCHRECESVRTGKSMEVK
ncbi:MAG TPA: Gfo/Idh/MocA family oxidoreductase [Gemmataceae bacterium]|jgi:predicted dehydrogenase|nr:Gfo/Idh/MocA family oxidoreductase [Gemmataceae bacterium]